MEIFMRNIPYSMDRTQIVQALAQRLHGEEFSEFNQLRPFNFRAHIFSKSKNQGFGFHGGRGTITLPSEEIGTRLLQVADMQPIVLQGRILYLAVGRNAVSSEAAQLLQDEPYLNPETVIENDAQRRRSSEGISIETVQLLWSCPDGSYSIEWESGSQKWRIEVDLDGRQLIIRTDVDRILISIRSIRPAEETGKSVIFHLDTLPMFEREKNPTWLQIALRAFADGHPTKATRNRLACLDPNHVRSAQFLKTVRITFKEIRHLNDFSRKAKIVGLNIDYNNNFQVSEHSLFSQENLAKFDIWLENYEYEVAFQLEALLTQGKFIPDELMSLDLSIKKLLRQFSPPQVAASIQALAQYKVDAPEESMERLFEWSARALRDNRIRPNPQRDLATFQCHRVVITPVAKILEGPTTDQTNRVIRLYSDYQQYFLRVEFREEDRLQLRWDQEVDGPEFVNERFGSVLRDGLLVAGRKFDFLAYSSSALKYHAVWFVSPFLDNGITINADYIRNRLGDFSRVRFCPARYGARLSQAFSTTDPSSIRPDSIEELEDKYAADGTYFTDGVGTISPEMAKEVWSSLANIKSKNGRHAITAPSVFQIRLGGYKGTLCVDDRLTGRTVQLRQSMNKFSAPEDLEIEIARAFDRPTPMFLNRPLIMLLETLGVGEEPFLELQEEETQDTMKQASSFNSSARLFEKNGLGTAFNLTALFLHLDRIGIKPSDNDKLVVFLERVLKFGVNHVLRDFKYKARIPVPGSYQLVGVADEWGYLEADQIYACVHPPDSAKQYMSGPVLISRSPTVHPGDARMVHGVGKLPPDAPTGLRNLVNCVVFPCKGNRSLPSMLGGGDLDGDIYALVPDKRFHFASNETPADYERPSLVELDRPASGVDVANFVVNYMNNDILGIIATDIMLIADVSPACMRDRDCLLLAALHSNAVDFPKTGRHVNINDLPRRKIPTKPDWSAGEIRDKNKTYYESPRIIGKLFRAIELPAVPEATKIARKQLRRLRKGEHKERDDIVESIRLIRSKTRITTALEDSLKAYIELRTTNAEDVISDLLELFDSYSLKLEHICRTYSLSRTIALTEEEIVAGTIVANSTQPRLRGDLMAGMRFEADELCSTIREDIKGSEDTTEEDSIFRAWIAWKVSLNLEEAFGARSFGLLALRVAFDTLRKIAQERPTEA